MASDFVRAILFKQPEPHAQRKIDAHLIAALKSGPSAPMTARDWTRVRSKGLKRARDERKK